MTKGTNVNVKKNNTPAAPTTVKKGKAAVTVVVDTPVADPAAAVMEVKAVIDRMDYEKMGVYLQEKVKEGKVIRKADGKPFVGDVDVKFYPEKDNRGAYVFTTHYGKRANKPMTQDYWFNVLTQYVTILD